MRINKKNSIKISNKNLIFLLFVFILLFSFFYAIHSNNPHKGHDFYGAGCISVGLNRFSPYWYLGTYFYLTHPFGFNFLIFLPFKIYLGAILYWKFFFMFFYLLSFLTCYLFAFEITKSRSASFVSALVYLFNPYHLVESIIEGHGMLNAALALSPLCFYLAEKVIEFPNLKNSLALGLSLGLIMYTHPNVAFIFFPFILFYMIFRFLFSSKLFINKKAFFYILLLPTIIAGLVGANFWLPLILYKNLFFSTSFSLNDSKAFTVDLLHVATLHPISCCSPNTVHFFNNYFIKVCSFIYPIFLPISIILVKKNNKKRLPILSIFVFLYLLSLFTAAGLQSPLPFYKFSFKYVPLFKAIRCPLRFLFINSLCLSIIIGIGIQELIKFIQNRNLIFLFVFLAIFLYIPHNEIKEAFQTFRLPKELKEAYSFLTKQEYGRLFPIPIDEWTYTPEWRNIVNPLLWTFMYHKETVSGGAPNFATRSVGDYLNFIYWNSRYNFINLSNFIDLYNVKYIFIDKANRNHKNFILGKTIQKKFENYSYIVYLNKCRTNELFLLVSNKEVLNGKDIKFVVATEGHSLMKGIKGNSKNFKILYNFNKSGHFAIFTNPLHFLSPYDELYIKYKIDNIPYDDLTYSIKLVTPTNKSYFIKWQTFDKNKGYLRIPIALFQPEFFSSNKNNFNILECCRLDFYIKTRNNFNNKQSFLEFSDLSILHNKIINTINYRKRDHSKYIVIFNKRDIDYLKKLFSKNTNIYMVLNYAYFPNWIAKCNNINLSSYRVFYFLQCFQLNKKIFSKNQNIKKIYISFEKKKLEKVSLITSFCFTPFCIFVYLLKGLINGEKRGQQLC